jgi:VCBS repeat-containing protein
LTGNYGNFTFNANTGAWTYALNNTSQDVQALGANDTVHDTLYVTSADSAASHVIDVTIHGANDAPVISTDNVSIGTDGNGGTIISGLSVTDVDAASGEQFTLATAADSGSVAPHDHHADLSAIQSDLSTGLTYTAGAATTDKVEVSVTDSHGASDTVDLIFNVAQNPTEPVTLTGTTNKDVFFGTGYQDQFVFAASSNHDTVLNFASGSDHIDLSAINATSAADWFANHVATNGADTLVTIDAADTILVRGAHLAANDFILHTT